MSTSKNDVKLRCRVAAIACGLFVGLAGACDKDKQAAGPGGGATGNKVDEDAVDRIAGDLEPGTGELEITGDLQGTGEHTGGTWSAKFSPARGATNREGPYRLQLMTDLKADGETARVSISFHAGLALGAHELTYASSKKLKKDQVAAAVVADGVWSQDVSGTAELVEIGDAVTARFEFDAANRDGQSISVKGRARSIPFEPRTEGVFTVTGDEEIEFEGGATVGQNKTTGEHIIMMIARQQGNVTIDLPEDIEPGTYSLGEDGHGVRVKVPGSPGEIEGEIELRREGKWMHGEFELRGTGDADVAVRGRFDHAPIFEDRDS